MTGIVNAHTVITYPGWRGNNLATNNDYPFGMQWSYPCECPSFQILESDDFFSSSCLQVRRTIGIGKTFETRSKKISFCCTSTQLRNSFNFSSQSRIKNSLTEILGGGVPPTKNRTNWPVNGGAIAIQPGWFQGHASALFYINLGLGTEGPGGGPLNTSFSMVPRFEIVGSSDNPYPGTFCLPQVSNVPLYSRWPL